MDLYAGTPYWLVKNPLWSYYRPLRNNEKTRVAVIGAGITGALVACELLRSGIECVVVDKRSPATGSSCASTALLQYEIDIPLCRLSEMMPEEDAVTAYRSCLKAIDDLERLFRETGVDASFRRVPSAYYASNWKGLRLIREEYRMRKRHGLPVEYLDRAVLRKTLDIRAPGALMNYVSAQIDTYKAATGLMRYCIGQPNFRLFSHTEITGWEQRPAGYVLTTKEGHRIECEYVIVASGFEAGPFLPGKLMHLTSTFAIISQPVDEKYLWSGRSLIWETREPYLYIRTDDNNRIIVGGEDISPNNGSLRRFLLPRKAAVLERKFRRLYPGIPFTTEMAWAGTFSSTRDGLPLVGAMPDNPRMLFALGYGGNGITFSIIAARILAQVIQGRCDPQAHVFSPDRPSLQVK